MYDILLFVDPLCALNQPLVDVGSKTQNSRAYADVKLGLFDYSAYK